MSAGKTIYWNTDRIMHLLIGIAITVGVVLLMRYLESALLPFFAACFIAYLLQPLVHLNCKLMRINRRGLASFLTLIEVLGVVALLVYLFLPVVVKEFDMLADIVKKISNGEKQMPVAIQAVFDYVEHNFNIKQWKDIFNSSHIESILDRGSTLLEGSFNIIVETVAWLLTIIYVIFIMIDYPTICRGFKLIIPHKYRDKGLEIVHNVQHNMNHYFRGQGEVALCAALFYCIGFSIVGLPLAIPMGLIVGILYMIPYFQYITLIPVAAICFIYSMGGEVDFLPELGKCILVYVVSQCVCDYIITPHIMGKELGMNPAVILLALSVWGSLLGIIGMIIALPATSIIMNYYEIYISEPSSKKSD